MDCCARRRQRTNVSSIEFSSSSGNQSAIHWHLRVVVGGEISRFVRLSSFASTIQDTKKLNLSFESRISSTNNLTTTRKHRFNRSIRNHPLPPFAAIMKSQTFLITSIYHSAYKSNTSYNCIYELCSVWSGPTQRLSHALWMRSTFEEINRAYRSHLFIQSACSATTSSVAAFESKRNGSQ